MDHVSAVRCLRMADTLDWCWDGRPLINTATSFELPDSLALISEGKLVPRGAGSKVHATTRCEPLCRPTLCAEACLRPLQESRCAILSCAREELVLGKTLQYESFLGVLVLVHSSNSTPALLSLQTTTLSQYARPVQVSVCRFRLAPAAQLAL